jgi:hypothetical protein
MNGDRYRIPHQADPPEGVDPGQWALELYREWRARMYGDEQAPEVPEMDDLLAAMREEPSA